MPVQELAETLTGLYVPIHHNEDIAAAALRADSDRVRRTGRRLVRHGHDRRAVVVGLALLATDNDERDIPLIRTIGLLSNYFGPLAARALRRRRHGTEALTWLGDRTAGWGRVYVVEACAKAASRVRGCSGTPATATASTAASRPRSPRPPTCTRP